MFPMTEKKSVDERYIYIFYISCFIGLNVKRNMSFMLNI